MTDPTEPDESALDADQAARAEALAVARAALTDSGHGPLSHSDTLPKRFGSQDLVDLAEWILTGTDPLAVYRDEREADAPPPPPPPGSVQRQQGAE